MMRKAGRPCNTGKQRRTPGLGCLLHWKHWKHLGTAMNMHLPSDFSAGRYRARLSTGMQHAGDSRVHAKTGDVHKSEPARTDLGA